MLHLPGVGVEVTLTLRSWNMRVYELLSEAGRRILPAKMPPVRTLIVEDHEEFRNFLGLTLQQEARCIVIGEAVDGPQAVQQAEELQPDLILLDLSLPRLNGMEALRRIRKLSPSSKVIILSQDSSPDIVQGALRLGAVGYLLKSDAIDLPLALDAILQGEVFVSRRLKSA